jgi:hypothetical protein
VRSHSFIECVDGVDFTFFPARLESVFFSGFEHALTLFHLVPIYFALVETFISTSFDHRILKRLNAHKLEFHLINFRSLIDS